MNTYRIHSEEDLDNVIDMVMRMPLPFKAVVRELDNPMQRRHGLSKSRAWNTWQQIRKRCYNVQNNQYKYYGGRGISVCKRWWIFENFLADMGHPPEGKTLDRIDNDGDYEPSNCRWATPKEQARNRRNVRLFEYKGRRLSIPEIAEEAGIPYSTMKYRLVRARWSLARAISEPLNENKQRR